MNLTTLLFNPNGRINTRDFWRGVILLVGAMIILQVLSVYGGPILSMAVGLFSFAMPYAYLCVFGKRLHDTGRSAWWFLAALGAYIVLATLLSLFLVPLLAPGSVELQEEMQMIMEQGQFADAMAYMPAIAKAQMIPTLLGLFAVNAAIGYVVARLNSDPGTNEYGPPTGGGDASDTLS